jgi:hypothetical protein
MEVFEGKEEEERGEPPHSPV